ncbi:MAG: 50S ribosomal protein L9 [Anaerovoracaceae bacterium]|jgi:large subunit ribosomal protein L9
MIVILKRDVKGSGKAGDIVKVSDGYARNMLIPRGYAVEATKTNMHDLEKIKEKKAEEAAKRKADAEALAKKLDELTVTIKTKCGEGGRLFGSITSMDIEKGLKEQHDIAVDKKKIQISSPIKNLGDFSVKVKLHPDVSADLAVKVVEA